jgi:cell wall assembly regulator SMI1
MPQPVASSFDQIGPIPALAWGFVLMTPARAGEIWMRLDDLFKAGEAARGPGTWRRSLLPIAENFGGDYYCVDLAPKELGRVWFLDRDVVGTRVAAASLGAWLSSLLEDIRNGLLVYDAHAGIIGRDML